MSDTDKKLKNLKNKLKLCGSVVVAYSGGVDSTFLLKIAKDVLGKKNVLAVTAKSEVFPDRELKEAQVYANKLGIDHIIIRTKELKNRKFVNNPINRCYYCKKELFSKLKEMAKKEKINHVIEGTNFDDLKDLRFGPKAAKELNVKSPLLEARLGKKDIRKISKGIKLPTWNKPTFACMASRLPYHQTIKKKDLKRIESLENFLRSQGFRQVRVRIDKNAARIEVESKKIHRLVAEHMRAKILNKFKGLDFTYVTVDLKGYRTGSMNESL